MRWFQIQTQTLPYTPSHILTLTLLQTLTQPRKEAFCDLSLLAEHWSRDHIKISFYPTSRGVIRNQRKKIRRNLSTNSQNTKKYNDFWKFLGEWFSICNFCAWSRDHCNYDLNAVFASSGLHFSLRQVRWFRISVEKYVRPYPQIFSILRYKNFWKIPGDRFGICLYGDRKMSIRQWYICRLCSVSWQYHKTLVENYQEARKGRVRKGGIATYVYTNPIPPSRMELSAGVQVCVNRFSFVIIRFPWTQISD